MVTLNDVRKARVRIQPYIRRTPLIYSQPLSALLGAEIYLKADNLQVAGAFKIRGAMNTMLDVKKNPSVKGVVAASSGNYAQAISLAAKTFGLQAVVVMPEHASPSKIKGVQEFGGEIVFGPEDPAPRYAMVRELQESRSLQALSSFDDERMIAGNGSAGLEIMEDLPDADVVLVPVSGGGLLSGVSVAVCEMNPKTRVFGVQGAGNGAAKLAFERGEPVTKEDVNTLADGLIVRRVGNVTFPHLKKYVEDILLVPEEIIPRAVALLLMRCKLLVEAAGAVGLAALMADVIHLKGKKVVLLLSGGNIDEVTLQNFLNHANNGE